MTRFTKQEWTGFILRCEGGSRMDATTMQPWIECGERLREVDPKRFIALLEIAQRIVASYEEPIGAGARDVMFAPTLTTTLQSWIEAGERLREVDPKRFLALLEIAQRIVASYDEPIDPRSRAAMFVPPLSSSGSA